MKQILLLLISITLLASCGPHRMKCGPGAKGICKTYHYHLKSIDDKKQHATICFNEN